MCLRRNLQDPPQILIPPKEQPVRLSPNRSHGRAARLLAGAVGAVAVAVFAVPTSAAAAPQPYGASALASVSNAVDRSGVAGIAWYTDSATGRLVVEAD